MGLYRDQNSETEIWNMPRNNFFAGSLFTLPAGKVDYGVNLQNVQSLLSSEKTVSNTSDTLVI